MIIIGIHVYIHIHPAYILHIKDSVCIELLGVLCTPLKNIGGARAPLAPLPMPMTRVYITYSSMWVFRRLSSNY